MTEKFNSLEGPSWTLFCDESGNAGPNYLDSSQPFHVSAGVLIRKEKLPELAKIVARIGGEREIKGARLMKSERGRETAGKLLQQTGVLGAIPFFIIYERSFSLAGKILELFVDPGTNPKATWLPLSAKQRREWLSGEILNVVSQPTLKVFAEAHRYLDRETLLRALSCICSDFEANHEVVQSAPQLLPTLQAANEAIDSIVGLESQSIGGIEHKIWTSLNLPAFTYMVRLADARLDFYGEEMDILHDEINHFSEAMAHWIQDFTLRADEPVWQQTENGTNWRQGVRNVGSFNSGCSNKHPGLQIADVLASSVARLFREILNDGVEWSANTKGLAMCTLPALMFDDPTQANAGFWVSEDTKSLFAMRLLSLLQ